MKVRPKYVTARVEISGGFVDCVVMSVRSLFVAVAVAVAVAVVVAIFVAIFVAVAVLFTIQFP